MKKFPGTLLIFEGPDGSGKTTQINLLADKLRLEGKNVLISSWKNAPFFSEFFRANDSSKVVDMVYPESNLFLQAADLLYRLDKYVIPALERGDTVLMDRGLQTLLVRGKMIGFTHDQIENGLCWFAQDLYKDLFDQAQVLFFSVEPEISLERIKQRELYNQEDVGQGTLLSQHLINNLKYAPDGERLTVVKRSKIFQTLQEQIVLMYADICSDDMQKINGGLSEPEVQAHVQIAIK